MNRIRTFGFYGFSMVKIKENTVYEVNNTYNVLMLSRCNLDKKGYS